jgi:hypothetical protein
MDTLTHFTWLALRRAESARGCKRCGGPIVLSDGFGLAEGICTGCLRRDAPREPRRGLVERLTRAA